MSGFSCAFSSSLLSLSISVKAFFAQFYARSFDDDIFCCSDMENLYCSFVCVCARVRIDGVRFKAFIASFHPVGPNSERK